MANPMKQMINKFNKLPTPAKAAVAVGAGMGMYLLFNRKATTAETGSQTATDQDGTIYYPYADSNSSKGFTEAGYSYDNLGYGGGNMEAISMDELGGLIDDKMNAWGENYMKSLGDSNNENVGNTVSAGGEITFAQASQKLYEAQVDYKNAKTDSERAAAAAAGQKARAAGATDAGADAIWKENAKKSGGSSGSSGSGSKSNSGSSNIMVQGTGGSGKGFTKQTDGTITVKYQNGQTKTIKPGEKGYANTHAAMNADLGIK